MSSTTKRYLRDSDYKKAILLTHLDQITQGDSETLIDAELDAKATLESILSDEYEIEAEFTVGENIKEFKQNLEYFKEEFVLYEDRLNVVNAYKNPQRSVNSEAYWSEILSEEFDWTKSYNVGDFVSEEGALYELKFLGYVPSTEKSAVDTTYFVQVTPKEYCQEESYYYGNKVIYRGVWFECIIPNGSVGNNETEYLVVQPIIKQWSAFTDTNSYPEFSQDASYIVGDKVEYNGLKYESVHPTDTNGMIQFPDYTTFWIPVSHEAWSATTDYSTEPLEETIVIENSVSYQLYNKSGLTIGESPSTATGNWRVVSVVPFNIDGRYFRADSNGFFGFAEDEGITYFVYEKNEKFVNFHYDEEEFILSPTEDPRNRNIVLHMVNVVLYCLTTVAVPDNVPESRSTAYEKSMSWLQQASDMKANPDIPRKIITYEVTNDITGEVTEVTRETSRWALSTSKATRNTWRY